MVMNDDRMNLPAQDNKSGTGSSDASPTDLRWAFRVGLTKSDALRGFNDQMWWWQDGSSCTRQRVRNWAKRRSSTAKSRALTTSWAFCWSFVSDSFPLLGLPQSADDCLLCLGGARDIEARASLPWLAIPKSRLASYSLRKHIRCPSRLSNPGHLSLIPYWRNLSKPLPRNW